MATILGLLNADGELKIYLNKLCCPEFENATLGEVECCRCPYSIDLEGTVAAGCGGSNYFPNNCGDVETFTPEVTFGPFPFRCEVVVGEEGLEVDDDLLIDGEVYEAGQHLVQLGAGPTGYDDGEGGCEGFAGGTSECNGAHTIAEGTVLATLDIGDTVTLKGSDNHGIDLYLRGNIDIIPA
jgi:hypothetical protein